jgi:hypothetical protein
MRDIVLCNRELSGTIVFIIEQKLLIYCFGKQVC